MNSKLGRVAPFARTQACADLDAADQLEVRPEHLAENA
jgi:hypothetical protein